MPTNSGRAIEVFTEAIQLPAEERVAFLDLTCGEDQNLRRMIESLLKSNDRVGDFLEQPAVGERASAAVGEKPGDQVDRYRLVQKIGEGGCGVVFLAEQEQPIRRHVALKVVKQGMDTRSVVARFEAERQALAMMDHPNIAHVFDAGVTASGRPYFVMELVEGVKITDYCDRHSLPIPARLELFIQVCEAIQHAHQKGIIHRDIKPSNILVMTGSDGKPAPKVIDFGIAKATMGQPLTDKTIFTAFEMLIGTPAYMSPEQAALTSADVDTRSDIYSLGVLLYELLTGTTPFDTRELFKSGFDEVRRVICDEEPVKPSTRVSTMVDADLVNFSKRQGAEAPKLIRQMRGDLDWIVMKALEKDRTRRYATANGLALDVGRYLSGEAILARPPSTLYKARKSIARNKLLYSGLAMIFVLLAAGLAVTTRLLFVERQRREQAQLQIEVYRLEDLASAQWSDGETAEAEISLRRAFTIRRQFLGDHPPSSMVANLFVAVLEKQNKHDEAEAFLFAQLPRAERLSIQGYVAIATQFGNNLAMKGRWEEAARHIAYLVNSKPDLPGAYDTLAPLLVASGNVSEYRRLCQQIISRFAGTKDPVVAVRMAMDCLILPSSSADLKAVGALADLAATQGRNHQSYPLFQCCKALSEYRQENFESAIEWAGLATKHARPYSKAQGYAILAMALFKSGQADEALTALAECGNVIEEKLPKLSSGNLGNEWRDWIIAHTLQAEAKQIIDGAPVFR